MRTNIVIDDDLMNEAMRSGKFKTKKETISAALELLIRLNKQAAIKTYRGKLKWKGNLNKMRSL